MYKTYKFRLKPTKDQEQTLISWLGSIRWIWNNALSQNIDEYKINKKFIFKFDLNNQLPNLKANNVWLKEIPSQALQNKIQDFDLALRSVWKKGSGFPKFKSKHRSDNSGIRIPQQIANGKDPQIKLSKKQIKIPKIGWINWVRHREIKGDLKHITIKKENNFWWICCTCELPDPIKINSCYENEIIGIDLGLKTFLTDSNGNSVLSPKYYQKKLKKLAQKQRQLARKKLKSKNREKAKQKLNKLHYKIKNQRSDFLHKTSTAITKQFNFITLENLDISGMIQNKQLSRAISDQGWYNFTQMMKYKTEANGGQVIQIGRFEPSSKTCSGCGNIQNMPLTARIYNCSNCGLKLDRDLNAAINIKQMAIKDVTNSSGTLRIYACGESQTSDSKIYKAGKISDLKGSKAINFNSSSSKIRRNSIQTFS